MSAIAGVWSIGDGARAAALCGRLLDAQSAYGPDDRNLLARGDYAAGRCLYRLLPEDRFDRQPLTSEDGRFTLVADLRIDNRDELLAELGLAGGAGLADSDLLLRGCLAWGRGVLERMIGDFAFALWDGVDETLLLARDTAGERPLHYRRAGGLTAFATMAAPLAGLPGLAADVDERRIALFLANLHESEGRSFFAGVNALAPGHWALASRGGVAVERYWEPARRPLRLPRADDYGDALREQLDAAVRRRLRRAGGRVGAQLSSGFDSSAVTTSAAVALAATGERLLALTAAPRPGFDGPVLAGRIADESAIAAATAALHANVDHRVVRPAGGSPLRLLDIDQKLASQPLDHICNNVWWQAIGREAAAAGVRVMLTGEAGNLTISSGGRGVDSLADLVRTGAWRRWAREARALTAGGAFGWLNVLNASLGPWLPERLYARLRGRRPEPPPFLAPAWREAMRRELAESGSVRHLRDGGAHRWSLLSRADVGNYRKRSLASWGVDERDPTNDRRLVEFCFSLPPEALLDGGVRRPALRRVLAGRVASAVLDQRVRGYQTADWYEQVGGEEAAAFARAEAEPGFAASVVDFPALEAAARSWPTAGWEQWPLVNRYRRQLLRSLGAARFVNRVRSGGLG